MAASMTQAVSEPSGPEQKSVRSVREPVKLHTYDSADDEILGLTTSRVKHADEDTPISSEPDESERVKRANGEVEPAELAGEAGEKAEAADSEALNTILAANAELKSAWDDAKVYREAFASPEKAREAVALLGDLNRLDALFFSSRTSDHARLAESIAELELAGGISSNDKRGDGSGSRGCD